MPNKKRINTILNILRLNNTPFYFLGSYNNPDFEYFSDIDVNQNIDYKDISPQKIKNLLDRIKKYGPELGFKFLEFKFGIDLKNYFRSERVEDYEKRWNKNFNNLDDAREFTKNKYKKRLLDVNASYDDIKRNFEDPNLTNITKNIYKLDILVFDDPNFTIELIYTFKNEPIGIINEFLEDIEKQKKKGKWSKVAKRLYSIAKYTDDEEKMKTISNLLKPFLKNLFIYYSLDTQQNESWKNYVKNQNINIKELENEIKYKLLNNYII